MHPIRGVFLIYEREFSLIQYPVDMYERLAFLRALKALKNNTESVD